MLRADLWSPQVGGCSKHHLHQSKPRHNENFPFFFFFETRYESLGFLPKAFLGECVRLDRLCAQSHISPPPHAFRLRVGIIAKASCRIIEHLERHTLLGKLRTMR